ncbi:hypothetical protein F511_00213 [Dorcoceras hygrometricum]|nr:hypothetical protein F511_00213 [Dorcoceras hygrometricum]
MNTKRLLGEGSDGGSEGGESKRRRSSSNSSDDQMEGEGSWQLRFQSNIPSTIFTGNRILSDDKSPVKVVLYDPTSHRIITSGSVSASKVDLVVLEDGGFNPDDQDQWMGQQFDRRIVHNREGRRPLITGELIVQLHDGVGHIGEVSFTDNSSWIRSRKFRLGARIHGPSDRMAVREGISNAFKVKDHRGESYQKRHPPSLDDQVWRLEKIAKEGPHHKKLEEGEIHCVGDFLRLYYKNPLHLRCMLHRISNKVWETIVRHALTCPVDNKLYMYTAAQGTSLVFNSVHRVVGATFDGQNYHSVDELDIYHVVVGVVEHLKQHAYDNSKDWVLVDPSIIGFPIPTLFASAGESSSNHPGLDHTYNMEGEHDYPEKQMAVNDPTTSFSQPYRRNISSSDQKFDLASGNSSGVDDDHMWSQMLHQDIEVDGRTSAWEQSWNSYPQE